MRGRGIRRCSSFPNRPAPRCRHSCFFRQDPHLTSRGLLLTLLLPPLWAFAPGLAWSRHADWKVIARAIPALLLLEYRIIHMDIVEHGRQVFVAQQFLQAERIAALDEVVHGKGMAQDVRADTFSLDTGTFFEPVLAT
jgi:hypothetical protein